MSPAFTAALRKYWSRRPFEAEVTFALSVVKVLRRHGAGLLLGSDSFIVVPGFSAVQELDYLVQAGLTPYEAMRTGTVNAARALHEEFGTVEIGKRADLVLLDANPLVDIRNVRTRVGVVLRGRWLPESELRDQLSSIQRRVASGAL